MLWSVLCITYIVVVKVKVTVKVQNFIGFLCILNFCITNLLVTKLGVLMYYY